ncbi:hypothetical protein [Streptomyces sp. NPDC051546]|uniref:hypothetical protein n=1 Tax=Streptomyces sp. NPDC051546 TaxID=3365655 RepID=UPI0037A3C194
MSSYAEYSVKAANILRSAQAILNNRPGARDIERAQVAVDMAGVYAALADTAARVEAVRSAPAGVEEECPDGVEGCLVDHSGGRGEHGPWAGEELTELEAKARTGGEW